jgi:hypothetical protein
VYSLPIPSFWANEASDFWPSVLFALKKNVFFSPAARSRLTISRYGPSILAATLSLGVAPATPARRRG